MEEERQAATKAIEKAIKEEQEKCQVLKSKPSTGTC